MIAEGANFPWLMVSAYCGLILVASLAGGWLPLLVKLTHTRLQVATSFVAGLMLGVGILHMLPHAWFQLRSIDTVAGWLLAGFLVMFLIQRFFHFHHHDVPDEDPEVCEPEPCSHAHEHEHEHAEHTLAGRSAGRLSWGGALFGLALHTLFDGVALAASVATEISAGGHGLFLGGGTFLVIILHKPFDAMAVGTLMAADGYTRVSRHIVNCLFALLNPLGVLLFFFGAARWVENPSQLLGAALAFAAGTFLCVASSDLLPELQFHSHDRGKLSLALLAGLGLAILLGQFETSGHDRHIHGEVPAAEHAHPAPH